MPHQRRLDLAGLDAEAAQLHLLSARPRKSSTPSGRQRARSPVRYIRLPAGPNGSATNRSAVSPAAPDSPAPGPHPQRKAPPQPRPEQAPAAVQNINPRVPDRTANRRHGAVSRSAHRLMVAQTVRLGRPIGVDHPPAVRPACATRFGATGLAGHDQQSASWQRRSAQVVQQRAGGKRCMGAHSACGSDRARVIAAALHRPAAPALRPTPRAVTISEIAASKLERGELQDARSAIVMAKRSIWAASKIGDAAVADARRLWAFRSSPRCR